MSDEKKDGGGAEAASGAADRKPNRVLTGLFKDRDDAERAYNSLATRGYGADDVHVLMSDETRRRLYPPGAPVETELGSKALEGAGVGAGVGGAVGATLAAVAAIGTTLALPGLGLIVAGPLAAALAGAGAGGLTGGLIGALIGAGIPEEHVRYYEEGIREGGIMMGVEPRSDEDADRLENEWKNYRGEYIHR
ncbi:MAG TPA: hypothetical protein VF723_17750 [Pyrinomonadaceae bacterium]|jgi:hypothetical protein